MMAHLSPLFLFLTSRSSSIIGRHQSSIGLAAGHLKMMSSSSNSSFQKATNQHKPSPLAGLPISPTIPNSGKPIIILRYMYEGGAVSQGRLCNLLPPSNNDDDIAIVTAKQIVQTLSEDGVDFDTFYACAYESEESSGGWMPLESAPRYTNPFSRSGDDSDENKVVTFKVPSPEDDKVARRIDIKLFRRPKMPELRETIETIDSLDIDKIVSDQESAIEHTSDALMAISSAVPGGKLAIDGYFGIGIIAPKTEQNVGTLWRSAYQLGASVLYTIGGRYKSSSTDTLNVPARIPLIELDDWNSFAEWAAPKAAVWVAIEMGGTPLSQFKHPRIAIYILGSEDHGIPKNVLRGCREVVSLESEQYGSYNVAVAGSLVMYDRMMKQKHAQKKDVCEAS
jgi:tRNA(Leu) C34 or U34 (ribose-2'-O)-methylase TrmL